MSVSLIERARVRAACCALAMLVAGTAWSAERVERAPAAPAEAKQTVPAAAAVPLATLGNLFGPMRLAGASASGSISVPLSARETLHGAVLHLVVSNSVSLLTDRSQLAVRFNDRTVAQLPLSSRQPETTADIRIPANLAHAGYNTLTFTVAQHSTENCEDPDSPELWTEIDTTASTLQMQSDLLALSPKLADLGDLIDPKQASPRAIAIVSADHPGTDRQLATGGLLAEGIALRLRYLAVTPRVLDARPGTGAGMLPGLDLTRLAGSDTLLVGTRDALRRYLDPQVVARIGGAFLGIYPKPDDPRHFVFLISGRDDAEVNKAARAFAHPGLPLPDRNEMTIGTLDEPVLPPWSAAHTISGAAPHAFRELGFTSRTLRRGDQADLDVVLPADIYAPEDQQVVLDMNFSEGAKMREDSVLNILLNGRFEQVIALDQPHGAVMRHYRISIPLRSFRAGPNTLSLQALLVPLVTDHCAMRQIANLALTVFDDSTLTLPPAAHFTTLPDLKRLADSGFPYTASPDGSGLAVRLAANDNDTLAAAWSVLAQLAQRQMSPLADAQVTLGQPPAGRNTILIGAASALPATELAGAPWSPEHSVSVSVSGAADAHANGWLAHVDGLLTAPARAAAPADVTLHGTLSLAHQLLVMQYRGTSGGTMTVLTAANAAELLKGVAQLVEPASWTSLDGDVALLTLGQSGLWTERVGATYETGSLGVWDRLGFMLSRHPWLGYAALVLLLVAFAASTALWLKHYKRNTHRGAEE